MKLLDEVVKRCTTRKVVFGLRTQGRHNSIRFSFELSCLTNQEYVVEAKEIYYIRSYLHPFLFILSVLRHLLSVPLILYNNHLCHSRHHTYTLLTLLCENIPSLYVTQSMPFGLTNCSDAHT